jgi:hypothetical protein
MSKNPQSLRDEICELVLAALDDGVSAAEAAVACMGAAAIMTATMPPEIRAAMVEKAAKYFPQVVEKRAAELRAGDH